jgi:hypothetical protein
MRMQNSRDHGATADGANHSANQSAVQPPHQQTTIASTALEWARAFHEDQNSGLATSELKAPVVRARDLIFGEKIAHGMCVSFGTGNAQIHIKDTELKPILESIRSHSTAISDCIERYQGLSGITPSKAGFRVFSLVLRKVMAADEVGSAQIKSVCQEALTINLASPADTTWKREWVLPINGVSTKLTISIIPLSTPTRAIVKSITTDVPAEDRDNRYAYRLTMEPEAFRESPALRRLKGICRQCVAVAGLASPMAAAEYAMSTGAVAAVMPQLSGESLIQRGALEVAHFSVLAAIGVVTYLAHQAYNSSRLLRREESKR